MSAGTALDRAHAAMQAAPEDAAARLRFYGRLADGEMFLLLEPGSETTGALDPQVFGLDEGRFVMAFDREDRLAEFAGGPAPYAALPGRVVAAHLAGQGIGIGLNLGVAPSAHLLPAEAVDWLARTVAARPEAGAERPEAFAAPGALPEALLTALDTKLALCAGLAVAALLAEARYAGGRRGHLLAILGAAPGAHEALAGAISEALVFSGIEAGQLDVTFLAADDAAAKKMAKVALRIDLPGPATGSPRPAPAPPGSDPDRPPKLR